MNAAALVMVREDTRPISFLIGSVKEEKVTITTCTVL
jgi:hypothetical protein